MFAVADRILVQEWRNKDRRKPRALYAPVALVSLPLVWMLSVTFGFSFIFWAISHDTAQRSFEISGSSLFTLGFAEPEGTARIWLTFIEATIGLGLVALLISYLPTIYAAHRAREKGMNVLRPFAGTPPSPVDMLLNLHSANALDNLELWRTIADWTMTLDQTHSSFPTLCFFPEADSGKSWVASVGTMVDGAALLLSLSDFIPGNKARGDARGHVDPGLRNAGIGAGRPRGGPSRRQAGAAGRSDEAVGRTGAQISIRSDEYLAALDRLGPVATVPAAERDVMAAVRLDPFGLRPGPQRCRPHDPGGPCTLDHGPPGPGRAAAHHPAPPHRRRLERPHAVLTRRRRPSDRRSRNPRSGSALGPVRTGDGQTERSTVETTRPEELDDGAA